MTSLKLTFGHNSGAALNPAADFGPRLIAYSVGYSDTLAFGNNWWVIGPWVSNLAGSMIGGATYDALVFVGSESPVNRQIQRT